MSYPSPTTIKKLSILSGNLCASPKCTIPLVDEESGAIIAEICHIKARNAGGPRYDQNQTNEEREAFENLILMCPVHHKIIDDDEGSYTVERLIEIKKNHESRFSLSVDGGVEQRLESYLKSLIEKGNTSTGSSKIIKEENSSLMKAQKLAREKEHKEYREKWLYSEDGLKDTINSVNEIYSLIRGRFSPESNPYSKIGIILDSEKKLLRAIYTQTFACKIELKGFRENSYNNRASEISFEIILFKKRPTRQQPNTFFTDFLEGLVLRPDLGYDKRVRWKNPDNPKMTLSAEEVCEKLFDLLINQISKEPIRQSYEEESDYDKYDGHNDDYLEMLADDW